MRQIKRIDGPYQNGPKWRLRVVTMNGERKYHPVQYDTREKAARAKGVMMAVVRRESGPIVGRVIDEYETFLRTDAGNQPRSIATTISRLKRFFAEAMDEPLTAITASRAEELKRSNDVRPSRQGPPGSTVSRETRRGTLAETKTFIRWASGKGYASLPAFEALRLDTARGKKIRRNRR